MTNEKFATNLALYLNGNDIGKYKEIRQHILDFLERQEFWYLKNETT